jgi:UDP-N-acetyl-D-mannosaminuronate dehydrogenase
MIDVVSAANDTPLPSRLADRTARVAVVGLGAAGLPLALRFARHAGFATLGVDLDPARAYRIVRGQRDLPPVRAREVAEAVRDGKLEVSTELARIAACDAVVLCVELRRGSGGLPDASAVARLGAAVAPLLHGGQVIVLDAPPCPGLTDEVLRPILERGCGLRAGADFFLAVSPRRPRAAARRGGASRPAARRAAPRLVGGHGASSVEAALALYRAAFGRVLAVGSARAAEAACCGERSSDGPAARVVELAVSGSADPARHALARTLQALSARGERLAGARVLLVGLGARRAGDPSELPALRLAELLEARGALVCHHDPGAPRIARAGAVPLDRVSVPLSDAALESADVVIVATEQAWADPARLSARARLVVDARRVLARTAPPAARRATAS